MLAVQDGLLDLDEPITTYLPDFTVNSRWESQPQRQITLRHLLNHTAGFTHEAPVGNNYDPASPSWDTHLAGIPDTWLKFPVGERYAYSNLGIEVASLILQEATGMPFAAFVDDRLFEPLGMHSSFVNTRARNGSCGGCATGHSRWFTRLPTYIPMEGAGGLRMTLKDAIRYLQFHLNRGRVGDKQLLASRYVNELTRPSVQIATFAPMLRYGLGFAVWGDVADTYTVEHQGSGFGFSAIMRWYPEYGIGLVVFLNTIDRGPDWDDFGRTLIESMINRGLVEKVDDPSVPTLEHVRALIDATKRRHPLSDPGETSYQSEWEAHLGKYCGVHGGDFVFAANIDTSSVCFNVYAQDGFLYHDSGLHQNSGRPAQRLVHHEPGLFFTEVSGEALDLRKAVPTFRNIKLRKVLP